MEFSNGQMAGSTWEIFKRIKSMVMETISGQMEGFIRENGVRASSMVRDFTLTIKQSQKWDNGIMES